MKDFNCGLYFDCRGKGEKKNCKAEFTIYLKLYRQSKNVYLDSGFSSYREGFDGQRFVGSSESVVRLNAELRALYDRFRLWCLDFDDKGMSNKAVKMYAEKYLGEFIVERRNVDHSLMTLSECYQEYMENVVESASTRTVYNTTLNRFRAFDKAVLMRDVDAGWLRAFERHMVKKGLKVNSRGQSLRCIRAVTNYALEMEYINHYPFKVFKIKEEETPMRVLSREEIIMLRDYPLTEDWQRKARDMWMLSFYLFGINNCDLFQMKKLVRGRAQYRRGKTKKMLDVAVPKEAMDIIERYRGKDFLLDVCDTNKDYHYYVRHLNEALQTIGMTIRNGVAHSGVALFPDLTMYWARYSAATLMAELDVPMETISQCLGHSEGKRVTRIYVQFNRKKIDEAQRRMIDALG